MGFTASLQTISIDHDAEDLMAQNTRHLAEENEQKEEIQEWDVALLEPAIESNGQVTVEPITVLDTESAVSVENTADSTQDITVNPTDTVVESGQSSDSDWRSPQRAERFQVLYFDVNGVTFAVPLDELGGIHKMESLNHLIGRPDWYLGLFNQREQKLDVVDTAKWVMADKLVNDEHRSQYQYVVRLGDSNWGLSCTTLMGTETLSSEQVRWREQPGKRPWLAGMVTEKMCVLIHVNELITMLNAGLDVKALDE